jgi:hypothetical protein
MIGGEVVNRPSWLDYFVRRFQDRWETNPQYRAMVSGGVGLVLILTLCTCTGVMTVVSNNALVSLGLASSGNGSNINSNTGTNKLTGGSTFPTATFNTVPTGGATPIGSPIGNSTTPVPSTTVAPTEGADPTAAPTSGSNNSQFVCTGTADGVTWTFNPCPLIVGKSGSLTISAPAHPNAGTNIIVSFGACPKGDCTIDDPPSGGFKTNASGVEVISFTVASDVQVGVAPVTGEIGISGGPTTSINTVGSCQ